MKQASRPPWLGIELRHLTALSAIARERSFRAAADRLGYVQSAISQQIAHLEEIVGARLVDRRRGASAVSLTEAGELLLHHFDEILGRIGAAQADLDALRCGRVGQLRIGVHEWVAGRLMPQLLVAFGQRLPGIEVRLDEAHPSELAAAVEAGELDVAFADFPLPPGPFDAIELLRDPYVLLAPRAWPAAAETNAGSFEQIARMPLIGHAESRAADRVDGELRACGIEPRYVLRSASTSVVQALVAAGLGAALVPQLAVDADDERTVAIVLDGVVSPRAIALYWHRERSHPPALDSFREVAVTSCKAWHNISDALQPVQQR
jgi:DNA-binding transcriptional LysR family regulator